MHTSPDPVSAQALASSIVASSCAALLSLSGPLAATGVTAAILFMAFTGTAAGLLCSTPTGTRRRLFGLAFAYTAFAAGLAIFVPHIPGCAWMRPAAPSMGLLVAFFAQFLVPVVGPAIAARFRRYIGGNT